MAVTAIVRIPLSDGMTREAARAAFEASAPRYRGIRGLVRKYYLFSEEARTGGGASICSTRGRTPSGSTTTPGRPISASATAPIRR